MWSFFSRDPSKVFSYDIGEKVEGDGEFSIWSLHEGKHKTNGQEVSIFIFNVAENSEVCKQIALSAIKRLRTLRHPNVLTFIDSLESDKFIYLVTEPVKPLSLHLKNLQGNHDFETSWGLHQIVKGLGFLINSVNLIHNNVCLSSMYVNPAGEWKLGGIDYMYPASGEGSNIPPCKPIPSLEKYDPPEKSATRSKKSHKWSVDMWGMGCLVWEVYNGRLPRSSSLKVTNKIPKSLLKNYCELVSANPLSRPSPDAFLEGCLSPNSFMSNHFVSTNLFLEEIQIKDQKEQIAFFEDLASHLDDFPTSYSKFKILPQLLNVYQYGNAGPAVLPPLFKLGKVLNEEEYQSQIVPCVVKLFTSTDRATRIHLLRQLPLFAEHLKPQVVNSQVFPNMVTGFMDTNPAIREQTVKGMLLLAPKLNEANLNTELMKHFARLQSRDEQGPIRTNTTVCLGKITQYLNPITRQRVITSAFGRAMKDPFPAARTAGVLAMVNTIKYFSLKDCAFKAIPCLSMLTVDPDKGVREHVFKALKAFIEKLEEASKDPEKAAKIDEEANVVDTSTAGGPATPAKWTGWMATGVTSLTSKLYSSTAAAAAAKSVGKPPQQNPANNTPAEKAAPKVEDKVEAEVVEKTEVEEKEADTNDDDDDDGNGWDDDDDNWDQLEMEDDKIAVSEITKSKLSPRPRLVQTSQLRAMEDQMWQCLDGSDDGPQETLEKSEKVDDSPSTAADDGWNDSTWAEDPPEESNNSGWNEDSWNDGWGDEDSKPQSNKSSTSATAALPSNTYNWNNPTTNNENGSDFFDDFTTSKPKKTSLGVKRTQKSIGKTTASSKPAKPVSKVAEVKVEKTPEPDDWGWGNSWEAPADEGKSKAEQAKLERLERRKKRQKELEERKANKSKLGSRVTSKCD